MQSDADHLLELSSLLLSSPSIDQIGALERIARIQSRSIKGAAKLQGLRMALSMIDLTTLEGKDTTGKVRQMCYKAQHLHDQADGLPTVAAVCVYPSFVAEAKKALLQMSNGEILEILSDDPETYHDIPLLMLRSNHNLLSIESNMEILIILMI